LALEHAAQRGTMKPVGGKLGDVRAARLRTQVGELDRTLVVVESQELLRGQKRGIAAALLQAKEELRKLERRAAGGRIQREALETRIQKALSREHLAEFVVTEVKQCGRRLSFDRHVDAARRRELERTRLGRRVLCTDRHVWSTGRIVNAFRGQWNVEELFRRAKKGGVAPWGPSHQWSDNSLRLHTFATVIGLELVSLARLACATQRSARGMMKTLSGIDATLVQVRAKQRGRPATILLAPDLTREQQAFVDTFNLGRWMPVFISSSIESASQADRRPAA
jgi:transposase